MAVIWVRIDLGWGRLLEVDEDDMFIVEVGSIIAARFTISACIVISWGRKWNGYHFLEAIIASSTGIICHRSQNRCDVCP